MKFPEPVTHEDESRNENQVQRKQVSKKKTLELNNNLKSQKSDHKREKSSKTRNNEVINQANISEIYEPVEKSQDSQEVAQLNNSKANTNASKSTNRSFDHVPGFSVFVGKDIFTNYQSQMLTKKSDRKVDKLPSLNVQSHIFHGKQGVCNTKTELLQAKRESRALRNAKNIIK